MNWTPEIIVEIIVSFSLFLAAYITYIEPKTKKVQSLIYIRLGLIFMGLLFALDLIANLFLSSFLTRISGLMLLPAAIFFVIGVNYIIRESYNSVFLVGVCCAGFLFCYLAFQPGAVGLATNMGFININWTGLYELMGSLFIIFMGSISFYWGFKTWLNAPFLIKREASIFLLGVVINGPVTLSIYLLSYWNPLFILFAYTSIGIGTLIFCIVMVREPKLLYILPFTLYRIIVKDREGYILFDHDWSSSNVHESVFTGFINAVQIMSEDVMNLGGLLDINLEDSILILNELESITVGLLSSKSSKLLRGLVVSFSKTFQERFNKELKALCREKVKYNPAYELIKSRKQPLLLSYKVTTISPKLSEKLNTMSLNDAEQALIKSEIQKAHLALSPGFLSLYDEIKRELEQKKDEEAEHLDDKTKSKNYGKN